MQADRGDEGGSWPAAVGGQKWALDMLGNGDSIYNDLPVPPGHNEPEPLSLSLSCAGVGIPRELDMKRRWIVVCILCLCSALLAAPWLINLAGLRVQIRTETQLQHDPQELYFAIRANLSDDVILGILEKKPYLLNLPASNGFTPLHSAIFAQRNTIVAELLQRGADANARTPIGIGGTTPLITAINSENYEAVSLLLAHGADPQLPTRGGETPLARAEKLQHWKIANLLRNYLGN